MLLVRAKIFFRPTWQPSVALDRKAVSAVATTEPTDARSQAAERILLLLLRYLRLLHRLCEWPLGKHRKTHRTSMLSTSIEV